MKLRNKGFEEKFWTYVDEKGEDECWGWKNKVDKTRLYPRIWACGVGVNANRISWNLHNGPIPDGLCVCHTCDNPICTNPKHLFLGTYNENNQDKCRKGRQPRGESTGAAKLTEVQVLEILTKYIPWKYSTRKLAKEYSVAHSSIVAIINKRKWKYLHA